MAKNLKKPVEIKFSSKIYNKNNIKKAVEDFSHLASFKIVQKNGYFSIEITDIDKNFTDIIKYEFSNYLLDLNRTCR